MLRKDIAKEMLAQGNIRSARMIAGNDKDFTMLMSDMQHSVEEMKETINSIMSIFYIKADDIQLLERIGSGAAGEVSFLCILFCLFCLFCLFSFV